jgi:signal transduction histidine kinase
MKIKKSLKNRITRAFVLLALVLSSFFTFVSYTAVEYIEAQLIDGPMGKVANHLIDQHQTNQKVETPPDMRFYADKAIPKELQAAKPGVHEVVVDGRDIQALVIQENDKRYAIAYEMQEFEQTEFVVFSTLAIGFLSSLLLAAILGIATARHIVAPVSDLASAVNENLHSDLLPALNNEDEIGVLARAFARRTDALQEFLTRERLFTGDVSHELRTPLTIMMGAAEMLQATLGDRPAQLAAAERIRRVAAETAERVSALLMLSRAPEKLDAPHTVLNTIIQIELDRCQYFLHGKPVEVVIDASKDIAVDVRPELAGIVIGNLLRNACQHTEVGQVTIELCSEQLVIEDTGSGIPLNVRERLFERFVHANDQSTEGIGLGLSIVKRVVEHVGWGIELEVPAKGGSRFILSFPPSAKIA